MARCILALDLAKTTGYACWTEGTPKPIIGAISLQDEDIGTRLARGFKWGVKVTQEWGVTDIAIEAPVIGGGKEDKITWLVGFYAVFLMLGAQRRINVVKIRNDAFFIFWCGTNNIEGEQRKVYSVLEAQRRGFPNLTMKQHDIADALGVLTFRCAELGLKVPWDGQRSPGPLFTGIQTGHKQLHGTTITKGNERAAAILVNKTLSFNGDKP